MASGSTSLDSNGKGPFQYSPTIQLSLGDVHKDFPFLCDRKYETTLQLVTVLWTQNHNQVDSAEYTNSLNFSPQCGEATCYSWNAFAICWQHHIGLRTYCWGHCSGGGSCSKTCFCSCSATHLWQHSSTGDTPLPIPELKVSHKPNTKTRRCLSQVVGKQTMLRGYIWKKKGALKSERLKSQIPHSWEGTQRAARKRGI